jgi:hypothetical protein
MPTGKVWGYKPVYSNDSSLLMVRALGPQAVKYPAKIYAKGHLIFQNDLGFGIHVVDNKDPSSPVRIGFIQLKGNSEMSIKDDYLYANSFTDLVILDISDWQHPVEVQRIHDAFIQGGSMYTFIPLPQHNVYYDCVSLNDGIQTGWVKDSVERNCYYP